MEWAFEEGVGGAACEHTEESNEKYNSFHFLLSGYFNKSGFRSRGISFFPPLGEGDIKGHLVSGAEFLHEVFFSKQALDDFLGFLLALAELEAGD